MKGKLFKVHDEWYVKGESKPHYQLNPYDVETVDQYYKRAGDDLFNVEFDFKVEPFWETGVETPIKIATLVRFFVESPVISDDFQIGPRGAYEHTGDNLDEFHYHELLDRLTMINDMMENYLIDHPVCQKYEDLKDTIEKAQDVLGEAYLKIKDIANSEE